MPHHHHHHHRRRPILSALSRSIPQSERVPLRDAVEYTIEPETVFANAYDENFRSRTSDSGYNYEVSYDRFTEFDPSQHELLPQEQFYGYQVPIANNQEWSRSRGDYSYYYNDDTVEILPADYPDGYSGRSSGFYGDENFFRDLGNYTGRYRSSRNMLWGRADGEATSKGKLYRVT